MDDFLEDYTKLGVFKGYPICKKTVELNAEQIWVREPLLQFKEEFEFYREVFEYILADLKKINCKKGILTEGAAYVLELIKHLGLPSSNYISITPILDG